LLLLDEFLANALGLTLGQRLAKFGQQQIELLILNANIGIVVLHIETFFPKKAGEGAYSYI